jgi:hypothetical protein
VLLFSLSSPISDGAKTAANLANILYHLIYFYVNNPKTTAEFLPPEAILSPLTLFKGG